MTHPLLTPLKIGKHTLQNRLIVAPMAGVTDNPFRRLCKSFGAGHAISEMVIADTALYNRQKSLYRTNFVGEIAPISAQIAGADCQKLAEAARFQVQNGAAIVDINMGCPAKKVCKKLAGSALLQDENLVKSLLQSAVDSVDAPVTLKTRLGFENGKENIMTIAQIAQDAGIAAIAIHGRTREDFYTGHARYDLIAEVKKSVRIPVIVNGDIDSPQKAKAVFEMTGADGIMIGRAAQGKPWLFEQITHFLQTGKVLAPPHGDVFCQIVLTHLDAIYRFYGEYTGCRIARKHIAWYVEGMDGAADFCRTMYQQDTTAKQYKIVQHFLFAHFARMN